MSDPATEAGLPAIAACLAEGISVKHDDEMFASRRGRALTAAGAHPQRLLWASTGVKDPSYDDTRYGVGLVAADVVNTMPKATLDAVADHGVVRGDTIHAVHAGYADARRVLTDLTAAGIDYRDVVTVLEEEGVEKFQASWTALTDRHSDRLTGPVGAAPSSKES